MTNKELAELDLAVAKAEGKSVPEIRLVFDSDSDWECVIKIGGKPKVYRPTRDGAEAMRLLEKHKLGVAFSGKEWECGREPYQTAEGTFWDWIEGTESSTPAIAICKAIIALKGKPDADS